MLDANVSEGTGAWNVVPAVASQGMRKVKHLTISIANRNEDANSAASLFYALVYVPEGYAPQSLPVPVVNTPTAMYAANQFVMATGVIDFSAGPIRIRSPLSRNLNSGDSISLIMSNPGPSTTTVNYVVRYAISLH